MKELKYLNHYPQQTQEQVHKLIKASKLESHLLKKYPFSHSIKSDKNLFTYATGLKMSLLKSHLHLLK